MALGAEIKSLRRTRGIRQTELAKVVGVTQGYMSQIETKRSEPGPELIKRLSEALGIPPSALLLLSVEEEDLPKEKSDLYKRLLHRVQEFVRASFVYGE